MIVYYLIIFIFILLLVIVKKKEFFYDCKYLPWGPNFEFCVNNCKNGKNLWDIQGQFCDDNKCNDLCLNCDNERCEWLSTWDKKKIRNEQKKRTMPKTTNDLVPKKLQIKAVYYLKNLKIEWDNHNDADKFMLQLINLSKPNNKVQIINIEGNKFEWNSTSLNINNKYSITMYALNKYGISDTSNNILITVE